MLLSECANIRKIAKPPKDGIDIAARQPSLPISCPDETRFRSESNDGFCALLKTTPKTRGLAIDPEGHQLTAGNSMKGSSTYSIATRTVYEFGVAEAKVFPHTVEMGSNRRPSWRYEFTL
jgi:hypothetical protein